MQLTGSWEIPRQSSLSSNVKQEILMNEFQYTKVPGKLKTLLDKIRDIGVPSKAHTRWLKSIGFTSSNDGSLLTMLKYIGFADQSGIPTQRWKEYRGNHHGQVLANAIRDGYSELYAVYPDAHARTAEELEHVFSTNSTAGKQVITKTGTTFRKLCELADFSAVGEASASSEVETPPSPSQQASPSIHASPSLHIDIQVHISPDATTDQIDQIFASMAKHLYKDKGDS